MHKQIKIVLIISLLALNAQAQKSATENPFLPNAESAPVIFQRETITIQPAVGQVKAQEKNVKNVPIPRFAINYSVELRDERALGFDYIHALNQLSENSGVMIFFTAPTIAPLPRFQIHKPVDVLFIDEQGAITEILPHHIPSESGQDFLSQQPAKAWLYLMDWQVAARDIRPHDVVQGRLFNAAPTVLQ